MQPQPYSVEYKVTSVQTLANGTKITRETREAQARASNGDQMSSNSMAQELGAHLETVENVYVKIAEDDSSLQWNTQTKVATRLVMLPRDQRTGCWADEQGNRRMTFNFPQPSANATQAALLRQKYVEPEMKTEDLGEDMIEGLKAHGSRTTTTIPAGAIGNDKPLVSTQELWMAMDFPGLMLRMVADNPRFGKNTREVTNLKLGEPDPAQFEPPQGYTVKTIELHQVPCETK